MVRTFPVSFALALLVATTTFADDKVKRDRDAAAALAMQLEIARGKKAVKLVPFSEAITVATASDMPVIAYPAAVKKPACPKGAVCATTEEKQIVVGYPDRGGLVITDRLPADAPDTDVIKAFKKAKARGGPVPSEEARDPFFIDLTIGLAISAPPACSCNGKLPCEIMQYRFVLQLQV